MKKLPALILALVMILTLAACGEPAQNDPSENLQGSTSAEEPAETGDPTGTTVGSDEPEPILPDTKTIYIPLTQSYTINGETTLTTYIYDENDTLVSVEVTDSTGAVVNFTEVECDEYGRKLKLTATQDGVTAVNEYTYDANGNVLTNTVSQDGAVVRRLYTPTTLTARS